MTSFSVVGRSDQRLVVRKPCSAASDCSTEEDGACRISCATDVGGYSGTFICTDNGTYVVDKNAQIKSSGEFYQQPDSAPCLTDANSICCAGECVASPGTACVGAECCSAGDALPDAGDGGAETP